MNTFEIEVFTDEIQKGLDAIRRMAHTKIGIRQVTIVEIEDETVFDLVKLMLGAKVEGSTVKEEQPVAENRKFEPQPTDKKLCKACREPLEANAARNARYCTRIECKRGRWREAFRKQHGKESEKLDQVLGEEATTLSPDPLASQ